MIHITRTSITGLLLTLTLAACATSGLTRSETPPEDVGAAPPPYRIGVDDVVQVSVWRNPELNVVVPVRPDGMISVPLIGDILAGGRVPSEVSKDIEGKLGNLIIEPHVAVILTELRSHEYLSRVSVTGAVRQPVSVPYRQGMTVLDVVLAAGGVNEFASSDQADLHRKSANGTQSYSIRLNRILRHGDLSTNYKVAPGDVITVPERVL